MNLIPWRHKRENENLSLAETHPFARWRGEMDDAFERLWRDPWTAGLTDLFPSRAGFGLRTDLSESDSDVTVTAELPGVDPDDVDISVSGNTLTIRGEKKQEKEDRKKDYHYVERRYGSFHRSIQLPSTVNPEEARPKRIAVKHE